VSSLRLVQAGYFSLSIEWDQPSTPVQGYRLTYGPRGRLLEQSLPADASSVTLESLQPDTEYVINLYPLFSRNGASPSVLNAQNRLDQYYEMVMPFSGTENDINRLFPMASVSLEAVQQLTVETVSEGSVRVKWRRVSGAQAYRLVWGPFTDAEQSRLLGAESTFYTIDGLQPDEGVVIGVAPIVNQRVGEVVTLSSRTNPSTGALSGLRATEVLSQRIRIAWSSFSRATGYKIVWRHEDGTETTQTVAADVSSYTIDGLRPNSAYTVQVSALVGAREGSPAVLSVRTGISFVFSLANADSVRLSWALLKGATGYILRWKEETDVGRGLSVTLPPSSSSYLVTGLRLGRRYRFTIQPTFAGGVSPETFVDERTGNAPSSR
uniref:Fibronectin type-III domain-containing protein n=1 Tax=Poecilia mexicana TaxID=48701 RepID=A0A3B3Z0Y5_9TELE